MANRKIINKKVTPRMFSAELIEKLSHVHPVTPLIIYVPVVLFLMYLSTGYESLTATSITLLFLGGVLFWTFIEYVIHRFVFHYEPKTYIGKQIHFLSHGVHHDYPRDPQRLVMPPAVSVPLALFFYALFFVTMGAAITAPFFSGFLVGYLAYDMLHYATHHFSLKDNKVFLWLKHYHMRHHYQDEEHGYGVSSPLWDYVFRTHLPKVENKNKKSKKLEVSA